MLVNSVQSGIQLLPLVQESIQTVNTNESSSSIELESGTTELSSLAQITMTSHISDLSYSETQTSFAYYKEDNSLALQARSETNIKTHEETYTFDITFSAEFLGLTEKDFEDNQPKYLQISFEQKELNVDYMASLQVQDTIRDPLDVLSDLAKAIRQVLKDKGNKTVAFELDAEARQALFSDPKIARLVTQLILLMACINLSKKEGKANHYDISVSGKGKPVINYQEKTDIESTSRTVNLNIKINPPASCSTDEAIPASVGTVTQV